MSRPAGSVLRDFFLAPEGTALRDAVAPVPPVAVVLGDPRVVPGVASALALGMAARGPATVLLWPPELARGPRVPASGAARRIASRLAARGCAVEATGRLVRARLPDDPDGAVAAAQRAVAAADCAVAIGLAGPRTPELDTLLTLADAAVLVRRPSDAPALTRLAEASLSRLGVPAVTCEADLGATARLGATAGLAVGSPARTSLAPALAALA